MRLFFVIMLLIAGTVPAMASDALPRTVIALYDSEQTPDIRSSPAHVYAEMPLNHLGLVLRYHDVRQPPPALDNDVRGILSWMVYRPEDMPREPYQQWLLEALEEGRKFVVIGNNAFWFNAQDSIPDADKAILTHLGLATTGNWFYQLALLQAQYPVRDEAYVDFERPVNRAALGGAPQLTLLPDARPHLVAEHNSLRTALLVTSKAGGYAADGLAIYSNQTVQPEIRAWVINPFAFFRAAFDTYSLPKPDVTTIAGRRIYFSHIDGDGWNSLSTAAPYKGKAVISATALLEQALAPYPDMPVAMAPIAADLDPAWAGDEEARNAARRILALPQVEVASHTYSHPFAWGFFENYRKEDEEKLLPRYKSRTWLHVRRNDNNYLSKLLGNQHKHSHGKGYDDMYDTPRAYAAQPFTLEKEVEGARDYILSLAPEGKPLRLLQWSGNTRPFAAVLKQVREAEMVNINGGDTRFDSVYPSYAWVSAIGAHVGSERQIYAAASNENTYTQTWEAMYHAFRYLKETAERTESPRRVKPLNIYYHTYSAQYEASLRALLDTLDYARSLPLARLQASDYVDIASGFYTARLVPEGRQRWRVEKRGALQTIRFDEALDLVPDMERSSGVIGSNHSNGSLYVYLDAAAKQPVIALTDNKAHETVSLRESRWKVWDWQAGEDGQQWRFTAQGYGDGDMVLHAPDGRYRLLRAGKKEAADAEAARATAEEGKLTLSFKGDVIQPADFILQKVR